jgi:hypothetical protein
MKKNIQVYKTQTHHNWTIHFSNSCKSNQLFFMAISVHKQLLIVTQPEYSASVLVTLTYRDYSWVVVTGAGADELAQSVV